MWKIRHDPDSAAEGATPRRAHVRVLYDENGKDYYLWVDTHGTLPAFLLRTMARAAKRGLQLADSGGFLAMILEPAVTYARENFPRFVRELKDFVRFPSVSAQPQQARARPRMCAFWLAAHLKQIGMEQVQVVLTKGHPVVLCPWLHVAGPGPPYSFTGITTCNLRTR